MKPKKNHKPGPMDNCQTPPEALNPIIPYLKPEWTVWESAVGEGYLLEPLNSRVRFVFNSDIDAGKDFFLFQPEQWDVQVTNPPYSRKYDWLRRSYELGKPFALLVPVETIGAKACLDAMEDYKLDFEWIFFKRRINFKMPNKGWNGSGAQFPTFWFTRGLNIGQKVSIFDNTK